jgi:hypothetical protein
MRPESLETRDLLSVLINAKPTLNVTLNPPHVTRFHHDGVAILQPTLITVTGTAQPPAANDIIQIQFFAEDRQGNLVNGGQPLGTATPDFLGRYSAQISLPSTIRKDVNYLVAYETAIGTIESDLSINPTTLSGLTGDLAINGTTLSGLTGDLLINGTTLSGLTGSLAINPSSISGIAGSVANPASTSTVSITPGAISGTVSNPATTSTISGTLATTPTATPFTGTSSNPASTSTLAATQATSTGTVSNPATTSTLTQTGTATVAATTGTDTQTGTATVAATTGTDTQTGTATIAPTTGSFTQTGTATIAATTGTATMNISEVAVSDPVTIHIHQPRFPLVAPPVPAAGLLATKTHPKGVHAQKR